MSLSRDSASLELLTYDSVAGTTSYRSHLPAPRLTGFFASWQVFVVSAGKIQEQNYETLYTLMTANKKGMCARIVFSVPKPVQVGDGFAGMPTAHRQCSMHMQCVYVLCTGFDWLCGRPAAAHIHAVPCAAVLCGSVHVIPLVSTSCGCHAPTQCTLHKAVWHERVCDSGMH